jgi:hypothetical protein
MEADDSPVHVLLIGHSFIRRLATYMNTERRRGNLGHYDNRVIIHSFGLGGASFRPGSKCIVDYVHTVMSEINFIPTVVFLHVGENDVLSTSRSSLFENLRYLIHLLSDVYHVPCTVISQLLPFPVLGHRHSSEIAINCALASACCGNPRVLYWKHRGGFWNPSRNYYLHDDVHLNSSGMLHYWRSVHRAVKAALEIAMPYGY